VVAKLQRYYQALRMRADHDRTQYPQYFPVGFDRLMRVGVPVRSVVDWQEGEVVICDDPGIYAVGKVSLRPAVIAALQFVVSQLGSGMS
jgi:hypothetical protein